MKFISSMAGILFLSSTVVAAPFTHVRRTTFERRFPRGLSSQSRTGVPLAVNFTTMEDRIRIGPQRDIQYSSNWAGAVQVGSGITQVSGIANFPHIAIPKEGNNKDQYGGSAWIGIDGDTCQTAILQTGMDWVVEGNTTQYSVWYEWLPEYSYNFDMTVNPGDSIRMKVVAHNKTSGTALIHNESTGQKVSHTFNGQQALCLENAEWIVEDFEISGSNGQPQLIPFAKFDPVTFTKASFHKGNTKHGVNGSTILDIEQSGNVVTKCRTHGAETIRCTYVD